MARRYLIACDELLQHLVEVDKLLPDIGALLRMPCAICKRCNVPFRAGSVPAEWGAPADHEWALFITDATYIGQCHHWCCAPCLERYAKKLGASSAVDAYNREILACPKCGRDVYDYAVYVEHGWRVRPPPPVPW